MSINLQEIKSRPTDKGRNNNTSADHGKKNNILQKEIVLFGNGLNDKKKEAFYSELHALLSSGIDIKSALEIIVEEQRKKGDKEIFDDILKKLLYGATLSEAMYQRSQFSAYEYHSIKIGEETGKLDMVLSELGSYYSKRQSQRKQIIGALTYPILVLITAFGAVLFMMNFIVPMFSGIFERFGGELPGITKTIVDLSHTISDNIGIFLLLVSLILLFFMLIRKKNWYRRYFSPLTLKIPLLGKLLNKIYLVRFCQSMALLISSKTPLLQTVRLVEEMIGFYPYEKALFIIEQDLFEGGMLHESMSQFSFFDRRVISLVKVGEEINQLDEIFEKLYKQYSRELEHQIGMVNNLLEPVMILIVGILVAVILIAMYLPLFQMGTSLY